MPLVNSDIHVTVTSLEVLKYLCRYVTNKSKIVNIHLKIDTGMSRFGINPKDIQLFIDIIKKSKNLNLAGLWTHLSDSNNDLVTNKQMNKFHSYINIENLRKEGVIIHVSASSPIVNSQKELWYDLIRPGLALYGLGVGELRGFKQVLNWYTEVIEIKELEKGTKIGYGGTYITERKTILGIIPVGYIHGYPIRKTKNSYVFLKGKRVPILGKISMEFMAIDCTDLNEVKIGDEVLITGNYNTIDNLIKDTDLLANEFVCNIDKSVKRYYFKGD